MAVRALRTGPGQAEEAINRLSAAAREDLNSTSMRLLAERIGHAGAVDPDPRFRRLAAQALAHVEGGEVMLLRLAADPEPSVREAALPALLHRPVTASAMPVLRAALSGSTLTTAAVLLARMGDNQGIPLLAEALQKGTAPADNAAALASLGAGEQARSLTLGLLARVESTQAGVLAARALGCADLTPAVVTAYRPASAPVRRQILDLFASMGPQAPKTVRTTAHRALLDPSPDVRVGGIEALVAFRKYDKSVRYRVIDALVDPDPRVRGSAAAALVAVGDVAARDELYRAGRDRSQGVRRALYAALLLHPVKGTAVLLTRLEVSTDVAKARLPGEPHRRGAGERMLDTADPLERLEAAAEWLTKSSPAQTFARNP